MQVKVWNDNEYPFSDEFKGDKITIPPKKFIEMEYYDAHEFRGKYSPIKVDGDGQHMPQSYKMIRIEKIGSPEVTQLGVTCQACGKVYESQGVLDAHIDEQHLESMADPEVAQKRLRGRPRKEA